MSTRNQSLLSHAARVGRAGATAAVAAAVLMTGCRHESSEILVSAASSLRLPLEEISRNYSGDDRVVLNSGASSSLARQIVEGAPVDLFISADEAQMAAIERAGRALAGTRADLLSNQLVVVVPADSTVSIQRLEDLTAPAIGRIGMGDPTAVPVGVYARQFLTNKGLWERLQPKVVPGGSVEMTLAAIEAGHVDAGFVYLTDARRSSHLRTALVIDRQEGPRIVYPAAIVRTGANPAGARRFLNYLRGDDAKAVFTRYGFIVL